jgi:hypothetical protein
MLTLTMAVNALKTHYGEPLAKLPAKPNASDALTQQRSFFVVFIGPIGSGPPFTAVGLEPVRHTCFRCGFTSASSSWLAPLRQQSQQLIRR